MKNSKMALGQLYSAINDQGLGLGRPLSWQEREIKVIFKTGTRSFRNFETLLRRVVFAAGDKVVVEGRELEVLSATLSPDELYHYQSKDGVSFTEAEIDIGRTQYSLGALEKLETKQFSSLALFEMRALAREKDKRRKSRRFFGFSAGKIVLLSYQLGVVRKILESKERGFILADEVGLGKSIEASLFIFSQIAKSTVSNESARVLVLVPASLSYQWFFEFFRKFDLSFSLFNQEEDVDLSYGRSTNPFLEKDLIIVSEGLLKGSPQAKELLLLSSFDYILVDEAHKSIDFLLELATLFERAKKILLLTATPESEKGSSFQRLLSLIPHAKESIHHVFRNTKSALLALENDSSRIFSARKIRAIDVEGIPKIEFTIKYLREQLGELAQNQNKIQKIIVLAEEKATVLALDSQLKLATSAVRAALFHSGLGLRERDRQAAYFADPEGAQVLFCSAIGSEGRNFQFANSLILYDFPSDPLLIEQRIGRLDRIGREGEVLVDVFLSSEEEKENFDLFENQYGLLSSYRLNIHQKLMGRLSEESEDFSKDFKNDDQAESCQSEEFIRAGKDVIEEIESFEQRENLLSFLEQAFSLALVDEKILSPGIHLAQKSDSMLLPHFPGLNEDGGLRFTTQRKIALARDDINFLTWDHPVVGDIIELFANGELGIVCVCERRAKRPNDQRTFVEIFSDKRVLLEIPSGADVSEKFPKELIESRLKEIGAAGLARVRQINFKKLRDQIENASSGRVDRIRLIL